MPSIAAPQIHFGLKHSKLCLYLCSFRGLNLTRSLVSILTPYITNVNTLYITKFLLKTEMEGDPGTALSNLVHSSSMLEKYELEKRIALLKFGS